MKKVLIVDDDVAVTNYFLVFLVQTGLYEPAVANDSREVEGMLAGGPFDALLLDMDMPDVSGMDILRSMRAKGDDTPVIVVTGVSDVDLAVRAMKLGAFDYLTKPVDEQHLLEVLDGAIEHRTLRRTIEELPGKLTRQGLAHPAAFQPLPTQFDGMIRLFHEAERLAASDVSIFIWGEGGTGKESMARAIHHASPRSGGPFVAVEADSQDPEKLPGLFFGRAGGWRGEEEETPGLLDRAERGTIFLDNIETMTMPMQVKLKRLIQRGEYYRENSTRIRKADVRMIVASKHDLTRSHHKENFSRDLLYHLMINSIRIPPLRERSGDIPYLAGLFLEEEARRAGKEIAGFSPEAAAILNRYDYPDNAQELMTIIAGAVAKEDSGIVTVESLPPYLRQRAGGPPSPAARG